MEGMPANSSSLRLPPIQETQLFGRVFQFSPGGMFGRKTPCQAARKDGHLEVLPRAVAANGGTTVPLFLDRQWKGTIIKSQYCRILSSDVRVPPGMARDS